MTKELAQTVGGKKIAWLIAILAAFAVFATLGTRQGAEADVVEADFTVTGPFAEDTLTTPVAIAEEGTTVFYGVATAGLSAGYQTPLAVTFSVPFPNAIVSMEPVTGPTPVCSPTGGQAITCTYDVTGAGGEIFSLVVGVQANASMVANNSDAVCDPGEVCVTVDDASAQAAQVVAAGNTTTALLIFDFEDQFLKTQTGSPVSSTGGAVTYSLGYTHPIGAGDIAVGGLVIVDDLTGLASDVSVTSFSSTPNLTCLSAPIIPPAAFPPVIVSCSNNVIITAGTGVGVTINTLVPANPGDTERSWVNTATASATFPGFPSLTDEDEVTTTQLAEVVGPDLGQGLRHVDVDQAAEQEGGNILGILDFFEDDDDAIGSLHTVCIFGLGLFAEDNIDIEWNIEDTELNPTVSLFEEVSGDDLPIPVGDVPCAQWRSAAVGDQEITATFFFGEGEETLITFDSTLGPNEEIISGDQPLVKEWNSIDVTRIVAVSGLVGGGSSGLYVNGDGIADNTGETDNFANETGSATNCERNIDNGATFWCGARANADGTTTSIAGALTVNGFVSAPGKSFIDYTLGSHTTHYNGPIDGAEQTYTFSGDCGSLLLEDPVTGDVLFLEPGDSETIINSNYGVGFTFLSTGDSGFDCQPGDGASVLIETTQDVSLTSADDDAPDETVSVTWFAQQIAKQPLLAWAGQRIVLAHTWADPTGCFARSDEAMYEIESGDGAFVPLFDLGETGGSDVFFASLGGNNSDLDLNECTSYAVYEQEFQGQVDIKATLEEPQQVHNFLVYYMEFEDITLGLVPGSRSYHNNGPFDSTGDTWDETTDTKTASANVSADVLLRARVRGWFKTDSLDTSGTNRPALDGKPSGRHVMPDDWLLLAGGATAPLFRPNYDTMLTPGGTYACGAPTACASSTVFGAAVLTIGNDPVVGPFSLLDPGPGDNSTESGLGDPRETFLPDGQINKWDAPMPPALVTFSYVNEVGAASAATSSGFLKDAEKFAEVYGGQNPYYLQAIPESPILSPQNYLWDTWGGDGYYEFWESVLDNRFPGSAAQSAHINSSVLAAIRAYVNLSDPGANAARIKNVYSDNHGEAMVFANGDFRLPFTDCETNVIGGGKHCAAGDTVGTSSIFAVADYPDFKKKPQIASTPVDLTWTWGGYKEVTIEDGETDQFKYIVFRALDRDGFCSIPLVQEQQFDTASDNIGGGDNNGALKDVWLTLAVGGSRTFTNTGIPSLVRQSISLHPVLSSLDAEQTILDLPFGIDPVESVDFTIDAGEGIIIGTSGGSVDATKRFASGVPTYSTSLNTTIKEFAPLNGGSDECQAWIRVSNSLLGILDVLVAAHDDEGDIINDVIVDFQDTFDYTLSFRWSLITWVGPDNIPVTDALGGTGANDEGNDITAQVTAVYGWDQAAQQWLGFFPSGVDVPGANDLTALQTGDAYWIAIVGPGTVTWTVATDVGP